MTYLLRHPKTGVYYFRRVVPPILREAIGKPVIKQSLGTKDVGEAKRAALKIAADVETRFEKARKQGNAPLEADLSDATIKHLCDVYLSMRLEEDEEVRSEGLSDRDYQKISEAIEITDLGSRDLLARGQSAFIYGEVDDLLQWNGINLDKSSPAYRKLAYALLKTSVKATEMLAKRHQGEPVDTPPMPAATLLGRPLVTATGSKHPLSKVFDNWVAERKPPAKTEADFGTGIRRFIELHGDLDVSAITKGHVRDFKAAMAKLPRALSGEQRRLKIPQLLALLAAHPPARTLSAATINKALGALQTVLEWASRNGYCDDNPNWSNPAAKMKVHGESDGRVPYDTADLKIIFNSSIFTSGFRPKAGAGEAAKWLPLLALFSGAREDELGQALVTDIRQEEGIWYLDINTLDKGKHLKTKTSRRKVPLHPEIIKCGFLNCVEQRKRTSDARLFPALKPDSKGHLTGNWSKWWNRYADSLGITDPRKVFHSFRHGFKDACRAARIPEEVHDALTGHSSSSSVGRRYGSNGVPLEVKAEEIARIAYKGLDLSSLHTDKT